MWTAGVIIETVSTEVDGGARVWTAGDDNKTAKATAESSAGCGQRVW